MSRSFELNLPPGPCYLSDDVSRLPRSIRRFHILFSSVPEALLPRFAEPIPNVTVTIGRDALLACVVDNLQGFKVIWRRSFPLLHRATMKVVRGTEITAARLGVLTAVIIKRVQG
jgi:hypothetical protein